MAANAKFCYCLSGQVNPILKSFVIDNSDTIKQGDLVMLNTDGHAVVGTATNLLLGWAETVVTSSGAPVAPDSGYEDRWTVDSDNETVDKHVVLVNVDPTAVYEIDFSAAIGTTSGSKVGARFDITDKDTVNEASATAGSAQVALVETTDTTTRGRVVILESQLFGV